MNINKPIRIKPKMKKVSKTM